MDLLIKDYFAVIHNTEEEQDSGRPKNVNHSMEKEIVNVGVYYNILNANLVIKTLDAVFADQKNQIVKP